MIAKINPQDVILSCRTTLGLPTGQAELDDVLLAGLLRRCAGILCPCSQAALRSALVESLSYLHNHALADRIEKLIDDLIVGGDLLELSEVAIDDPDVKSTWVFAAPPSYVVRSSGIIFLTGIVPDQDIFLPESLAVRVNYEGFIRFIVPKKDENLAATLSEQGVQELSEAVWLKAPKAESAKSLLGYYERLVEDQPHCGTVKDLEILDPTKGVTYYRGRWVSPKDQTGNFVARRPQEFGMPIWCFVQLVEGTPQHLIDLPLSKFRWRACDAAWHLQMAIDYCRGQPQRYRRRSDENNVRFDFFSPLPQWSQRRLMTFGKACQREKSLLAYELPLREAESEEQFLQERLWLSRIENK